ncbi:hypothetical protein QJQ45_004238 [Haematococcus lacustris]|nr:hypothetical protein QJQ45_004238 [Haematococcus lacustris]
MEDPTTTGAPPPPPPALYAPALFVSPHCVPACQSADCAWPHVIKVPGGAVLRGCKQTRRKLMAHFQLRAGVHSQLRVIASLYVLKIFLTWLVGYSTPGFRNAPTPPAVHPPRAQDAAPLPPLPLRVPAQPASMAMDKDPEPDPDPEPELDPEPMPPTKGKGKAAKAKPAPQPGRWLDRDCNATLNMQRIGESKWRPLELCYWPEQGELPAKGKEYPGLGYKRLRDKPPKAQQQQPAEAQ